jgi:hypothetical protein
MPAGSRRAIAEIGPLRSTWSRRPTAALDPQAAASAVERYGVDLNPAPPWAR